MRHALTLLLAIVLLGIAGYGQNRKTFNIVDFGAKAGGVTMNTGFIQAAIDAATGAGGGIVVVPKGIFLTGTILLKSNVELQLRQGAVLQASLLPADYQQLAFVFAEGQDHISITGKGTIDGRGRQVDLYIDSLFYAGKYDSADYNLRRKRPEKRPGGLRITNCTNVLLKGITVKDAAAWVQTYTLCENLTIESTSVIVRKCGSRIVMSIRPMMAFV
jgi:polygalacturonase